MQLIILLFSRQSDIALYTLNKPWQIKSQKEPVYLSSNINLKFIFYKESHTCWKFSYSGPFCVCVMKFCI